MNEFKKEIEEALHALPNIHQKIISQANGVNEEISLLEKEIGKLLKEKENPEIKKELLPRLCLLSEICSAISFERMIKARELFQENFPRHFKAYLNSPDRKKWQISWSGCLNCSHFLDRCNIGLTPREKEGSSTLEKYCPSYKPRKRR
jgi:hypothetical protein